MFKIKTTYLLILLTGIISFMSCDQLNTNEIEFNELKKGNVVIKLTDAPFPADLISEANIVINKIELGFVEKETEDLETKSGTGSGNGKSNGKNDNNGNKSDNAGNDHKGDKKGNGNNGNKRNGNNVGNKNGSGNFGEEGYGTGEGKVFITISEEKQQFNLLDLRNGITALIAESDTIPVGEYNIIRLHIVDSWLVLNDSMSTRFDLKIPGGHSNGLKIKLETSIYVDEINDSEILLDFDVSRSFICQGNIRSKKGIKGFLFKPVIRGVDKNNTGDISGSVLTESELPVENAFLSLISGADTIVTALSDSIGNYTILGIPPGYYTLTCEKEGFKRKEKDNLKIKANKVTEYSFSLDKTDSN